MITDKSQSAVPVRVQAQPFNQALNTVPLEAKGWRCFLRQAPGPMGLVTWILKRGACAVLLVQSKTQPLVQTISLPSSEDARELCDLFAQSGLARSA